MVICDNVRNRSSAYSAFKFVLVTYVLQVTLKFRSLKQHTLIILEFLWVRNLKVATLGALNWAFLQGYN